MAKKDILTVRLRQFERKYSGMTRDWRCLTSRKLTFWEYKLLLDVRASVVRPPDVHRWPQTHLWLVRLEISCHLIGWEDITWHLMHNYCWTFLIMLDDRDVQDKYPFNNCDFLLLKTINGDLYCSKISLIYNDYKWCIKL